MNENAKLNETLKGIYDTLTDEQKKQAKECKTTEELMALAGEWGLELPDEMLDAVAGGKPIICKGNTCMGYDSCI